MKFLVIFFAVLFSFLLTSCEVSKSYYYQIYKATPTNNLQLKDNRLVYEDSNCKILYNLWKLGGNIGFQFLNKTDKNIYLNLTESFFVLNGISYDYYKNRVFSYSNGTYNEAKIVCIPANTSKYISEYIINESLYRDCELLKYPTKKQIKAKLFTKSNSPFIFSNKVAYTVGKSDNLISFENEFYISEISNYPEWEVLENRYDDFCDEKAYTSSIFFRIVSPDMFYIKYPKEEIGVLKH